VRFDALGANHPGHRSVGRPAGWNRHGLTARGWSWWAAFGLLVLVCYRRVGSSNAMVDWALLYVASRLRRRRGGPG
jgi:hypothetical protein